MPIRVLLRRLDAAWKRLGFARDLGKPASSTALARITKLGASRDLRSVLAWHDGTRRELDGYYQLMSCADIVRFKTLMDKQLRQFEETWMPGEWWNRSWIPFLEFNGDLICVDADGRVVSFEAHDDARPVMYGSVRDWLATVTEIWEQVPAGADPIAFFEGRVAKRIRRARNRGYPIAKAARRRPPDQPPSAIDYVCATFARGAYEFRIECAGATLRTYFGRGISRRYHVKQLASVASAHALMERPVRAKLADGYERVANSASPDPAFLAAAARHLASVG